MNSPVQSIAEIVSNKQRCFLPQEVVTICYLFLKCQFYSKTQQEKIFLVLKKYIYLEEGEMLVWLFHTKPKTSKSGAHLKGPLRAYYLSCNTEEHYHSHSSLQPWCFLKKMVEKYWYQETSSREKKTNAQPQISP